MKKLTVIFLFISLCGYSQSHVWQDSLANYQAKQLSKSWGWWDSLPVATQATKIAKWYMLTWKAAKEVQLNHIADSIRNDTSISGNRTRYIARLISKGYHADNSLFDWQKLYNHTAVFGVNWSNTATYMKSISPGIDFFIQNWLPYKTYFNE